MTVDELRYALAKQIPSATAVETDYGSIPLDSFMRAEILRAVSEIFEARLALALAKESACATGSSEGRERT